MSDVRQIDFIFKQQNNKNSEALKTSTYKADGTGDAILQGDFILVPWTKHETYKFYPGEEFYMDTLITLSNSADNPETPIVSMRMEKSLFKDGDD